MRSICICELEMWVAGGPANTHGNRVLIHTHLVLGALHLSPTPPSSPPSPLRVLPWYLTEGQKELQRQVKKRQEKVRHNILSSSIKGSGC